MWEEEPLPCCSAARPSVVHGGSLMGFSGLSRDLGTYFGNQMPSHTVWPLLCITVLLEDRAPAIKSHFEQEESCWAPNCER